MESLDDLKCRLSRTLLLPDSDGHVLVKDYSHVPFDWLPLDVSADFLVERIDDGVLRLCDSLTVQELKDFYQLLRVSYFETVGNDYGPEDSWSCFSADCFDDVVEFMRLVSGYSWDTVPKTKVLSSVWEACAHYANYDDLSVCLSILERFGYGPAEAYEFVLADARNEPEWVDSFITRLARTPSIALMALRACGVSVTEIVRTVDALLGAGVQFNDVAGWAGFDRSTRSNRRETRSRFLSSSIGF